MLSKSAKSLLLISAALMLIPGELVQAQEEGKVIVLSPEVGETIDRQERDRYNLFPASQGFHSATVLQKPDGSYVAEITEERNGSKQVRTLPIDQQTLDIMRTHLEEPALQGPSVLARKNRVIIINKDLPQEIEGRLLGLQGGALLLEQKLSSKNFESRGISLNEIQTITTKKSYALEGFWGGLVVGGVAGAVAGSTREDEGSFSSSDYAAMYAIVFGPLGGLMGMLFGASIPKDGKRFELSQMSDDEKIALVMKLSGL